MVLNGSIALLHINFIDGNGTDDVLTTNGLVRALHLIRLKLAIAIFMFM